MGTIGGVFSMKNNLLRKYNQNEASKPGNYEIIFSVYFRSPGVCKLKKAIPASSP